MLCPAGCSSRNTDLKHFAKQNGRWVSLHIKDVNDELRFIELGPNSKITYKNTDGEFKYTVFRNKLGFFKYTIEIPEDGESVAYINNK